MPLAATIAPHIPFLRRYARALTGTQARGDAYVAAALEALVADQTLMDKTLSPKIGLFKLFNAVWRTLDADRIVGTAGEDGADGALQKLTPLNRQAFLLSAVEAFTQSETAQILGINEQELTKLINQAGEEIAEQMATRILIIEDEPLISAEIENMVETLGHQVFGVARTRDQALAQVRDDRPGLILADIQLADGSSGIDAVNDILKSGSLPVIFITAFPERLLTGERPEPAFLVTKPFNADMVKALISQALFFHSK